MIIQIFKCDICKNDTRLDKYPHIERGKFEWSASYVELPGRSMSAPDVCRECLVALQSALNTALDERRNVQSLRGGAA